MTDEPIERVRSLLVDAGYRDGSFYYLGTTTKVNALAQDGSYVESWVGGPGPTILIQVIGGERGGFEVYAPLTDSLKVDDTLRALVKRIAYLGPDPHDPGGPWHAEDVAPKPDPGFEDFDRPIDLTVQRDGDGFALYDGDRKVKNISKKDKL